ncbi:exopolysaccharide biosynthesis protein [Caldimonas tepidiphila]|uniref:exopolysaccharide biosynthesis protein n=1 Tax=Caldimonas tepidiphila TaxID=2315841 RepID=UPI000E5BCC76|nr:exopolysaccharide biosynthesis protein [Caldimonas tepidiphila]
MMSSLATGGANRVPLPDMLHALVQYGSRDRNPVGDLLDAIGDQALAALLFVFAFPKVLPVPPGTSAFPSTPLILLAAQPAPGRVPRLPFVAEIVS